MKISITFLLLFLLFSCDKNVELEKFDKDGNLIVYSEEVYTKMWIKNRNLKVTVIDTFCINQTAKAHKDIEKGTLIYFGFHPYEFEKLKKMLSKYGIETKEHLRRCTRIGGFEPYCYQNVMRNEIDRKYGKNFIDSITEIAKREFVQENPDIEYIEDGIDLRKKYSINQ
ncbi:MAG: hypothetical protein ACOVSR_07715 [Bacteroidia bacterium]